MTGVHAGGGRTIAPMRLPKGCTRWLVVLVLALAACSGSGRPAGTRGPSPGGLPPASPSDLDSSPARPITLFYADHTTLLAYDLHTGKRRELAALPSADIAVSPDGRRYAYVRETSPAGSGPEGYRRPYIDVGSTSGGASHTAGPGRSPLFSPDGTRLAAITEDRGVSACAGVRSGRPAKGRCPSAERVVAYRTGRPAAPFSVVLGYNRWSLIGWSSTRRLVAGSLIQPRVYLGFPGASPQQQRPVSASPSEVWGVSPAAPLLLRVRGTRAALEPLPFGSPPPASAVHLSGALLGDGAWSPAGNTIVATAVHRHGTSVATTLVDIDVTSGRARTVPHSAGAEGQVVWDAGGRSFVYAQVDPRDRARLQAKLCTSHLVCHKLFGWGEGVQLLALR